jgi:hypothetical protein
MVSTIEEAKKEEICSAPLPQWNKTYTVIPHSSVINEAEVNFLRNGLKVHDVKFRRTYQSQIVSGIYTLEYGDEYKLIYGFTNSYNKQKRFETAIGAQIGIKIKDSEEEIQVPLISKINNWKRKHTGDALMEAKATIATQIMEYPEIYRSLLEDLEAMKKTKIDKMQYAHMLGEMFVSGIISSTQLNIINNEFKSEKLDIKLKKSDDDINLFSLYILTCYSLKEDHPMTYLKNLSAAHAMFLAYTNEEEEDYFSTLSDDEKVALCEDNPVEEQTEEIEQTETVEEVEETEEVEEPEIIEVEVSEKIEQAEEIKDIEEAEEPKKYVANENTVAFFYADENVKVGDRYQNYKVMDIRDGIILCEPW